MNRINHFEIPSDHPEKSMKFYGDVFGWTFNKWGDYPYWLAMTGDESKPGINGAIMQKKPPAQSVVNSIEVENLDEMVEKIEKKGGEIVVPKMALPGVGWLAYFKDPDQNLFGVWQNDPSAK